MSDLTSPTRVAVNFVDHINQRDLAGLTRLMSSGHVLEVFDEDALTGRVANTDAWRGYFASFPHYLIHPHRVSQCGTSVAILGHTTGSHLDLPDEQERMLTLIWVADTENGLVTRWKLIEDNLHNRKAWKLDLT